jgi:hypothetical protein
MPEVDYIKKKRNIQNVYSRIMPSAFAAIIVLITGTDFQNHIFDKERNLWIPDSAA